MWFGSDKATSLRNPGIRSMSSRCSVTQNRVVIAALFLLSYCLGCTEAFASVHHVRGRAVYPVEPRKTTELRQGLLEQTKKEESLLTSYKIVAGLDPGWFDRFVVEPLGNTEILDGQSVRQIKREGKAVSLEWMQQQQLEKIQEVNDGQSDTTNLRDVRNDALQSDNTTVVVANNIKVSSNVIDEPRKANKDYSIIDTRNVTTKASKHLSTAEKCLENTSDLTKSERDTDPQVGQSTISEDSRLMMDDTQVKKPVISSEDKPPISNTTTDNDTGNAEGNSVLSNTTNASQIPASSDKVDGKGKFQRSFGGNTGVQRPEKSDNAPSTDFESADSRLTLDERTSPRNTVSKTGSDRFVTDNKPPEKLSDPSNSPPEISSNPGDSQSEKVSVQSQPMGNTALKTIDKNNTLPVQKDTSFEKINSKQKIRTSENPKSESADSSVKQAKNVTKASESIKSAKIETDSTPKSTDTGFSPRRDSFETNGGVEDLSRKKDPVTRDERIVVYKGLYSKSWKQIPLAKLLSLGYAETDVVSIIPDILEMIAAEGINYPSCGIPSRWTRKGSPQDVVKIVSETEGEGILDAGASRTSSPIQASNEATNSTGKPAAKETPEKLDNSFKKQKEDTENLSSTKLDRRRRRQKTSAPGGDDLRNSELQPPDNRRRNRRERSMMTASGSPKPIYSGRPLQKTKVVKRRSDPPPPNSFIWPDMDTFRSLLRKEAEFRLRILGDGFADTVKEETTWRHDLYSNWLWTLKNGIGNPIVESRSDRYRRMRDQARLEENRDLKKRRERRKRNNM